MRTTLDIADDVLEAVEELAREEKTSTGEVLSSLARRALTSTDVPLGRSAAGFLTLPKRGTLVTVEHVDAIREVEGI